MPRVSNTFLRLHLVMNHYIKNKHNKFYNSIINSKRNSINVHSSTTARTANLASPRTG